MPFNEVIEPVDFEEFVQTNASLIASDPLKSMLVFPADDIEVNVCQRVINTIKPIIPDFDDVSAQENPHINQCLRCYTSNWIVVNKKSVESQESFPLTFYTTIPLTDMNNASN